MIRQLLLCAGILIAGVSDVYAATADTAALRAHVLALTNLPGGFRNSKDTAALNQAGSYIYSRFRQEDHYTVEMMRYAVADGREYANYISSFGPANAPRIVIGAHYDVCGDQAGADDNASGVAALLELQRLLSKQDCREWKYRIDLVAFTLEEPPYFETPQMGSAVHAAWLANNNIPVRGMVSLEMVGYFRDGKNTQHYPAGLLKLFYGSRGNFITVVHKLRKGPFVRSFQRRFKRPRLVRTKGFGAPGSVEGVGLSDHLNYWARGWEALMITDTAFFRNPNYHRETDTAETLDYRRMAAVVDQLYLALLSMSK